MTTRTGPRGPPAPAREQRERWPPRSPSGCPVAVPAPGGGLALWCELPDALATALAAEGEQLGVIVAPGPVFSVEGGLDRFVRLPWTRPVDELEERRRRLARAWDVVRGRRPTDRPPTARVMVA